ncbi:radical SAM protein [Lichenicola cladoniae]|uniref:Radical SAM protein n=1 Tax=Lichenicola cladoniae TaxID=1484109 RepID=A0A6M8HR56_9PROT|nr:radical SAM protein [Lichenicola cladoniae]NPD68743.1 radical SAM protein [Acetobacteraceae bacterium]QKE90828.1 radical SAM protein [Lichenicola cladoniae]
MTISAPGPSPFLVPAALPIDPAKFRDPHVTARGEPRAGVAFDGLRTLWFNTGTLCNIACAHCYIESSPTNDALIYLGAADVSRYLDEIDALGWDTGEIGFTGGEPFMNRELPAMLGDALGRGRRVLVLTNAMRPMRRFETDLLGLRSRHGDRLTLRVSLDHHTQAAHEAERGSGTWAPAIDGLQWLGRNGIRLAVAGRHLAGETDAQARHAYAALFASLGIAIDAQDPARLTLFPEMDARIDVPEITDACWGILHQRPDTLMCASSRMVVKRRGQEPSVVACTLIPYAAEFELGSTLEGATGRVMLNHPHCARFCVLGGASCSG